MNTNSGEEDWCSWKPSVDATAEESQSSQQQTVPRRSQSDFAALLEGHDHHLKNYNEIMTSLPASFKVGEHAEAERLVVLVQPTSGGLDLRFAMETCLSNKSADGPLLSQKDTPQAMDLLTEFHESSNATIQIWRKCGQGLATVTVTKFPSENNTAESVEGKHHSTLDIDFGAVEINPDEDEDEVRRRYLEISRKLEADLTAALQEVTQSTESMLVSMGGEVLEE